MTSVVEDVCKLEKQYDSILKVPEDNLLLMKIRLFLNADNNNGRPKYVPSNHKVDLARAQRLYDVGMKVNKIAGILDVDINLIKSEILNGNIKAAKRLEYLEQVKNHSGAMKFELHRGDYFIMTGTVNEIANYLNVTKAAVEYYKTRYSRKGYNLERAIIY